MTWIFSATHDMTSACLSCALSQPVQQIHIAPRFHSTFLRLNKSNRRICSAISLIGWSGADSRWAKSTSSAAAYRDVCLVANLCPRFHSPGRTHTHITFLVLRCEETHKSMRERGESKTNTCGVFIVDLRSNWARRLLSMGHAFGGMDSRGFTWYGGELRQWEGGRQQATRAVVMQIHDWKRTSTQRSSSSNSPTAITLPLPTQRSAVPVRSAGGPMHLVAAGSIVHARASIDGCHPARPTDRQVQRLPIARNGGDRNCRTRWQRRRRRRRLRVNIASFGEVRPHGGSPKPSMSTLQPADHWNGARRRKALERE
jgi:hypothetical protein